jgi:hypothetical protein
MELVMFLVKWIEGVLGRRCGWENNGFLEVVGVIGRRRRKG